MFCLLFHLLFLPKYLPERCFAIFWVPPRGSEKNHKTFSSLPCLPCAWAKGFFSVTLCL